MVKKTQSIEGKNPTFLAFPHPDWFLPYMEDQGKYDPFPEGREGVP